MCTDLQGRKEHFSEVKEIKSSKQKLKMDLFSRAPDYLMNALVRGLSPSVSRGVIHASAKRLWKGPGSHLPSSDLCSEIPNEHFFSSGGELSLGRLSSSQDLKGQEVNLRGWLDGVEDRKESGTGFSLVGLAGEHKPAHSYSVGSCLSWISF